MSVQDQRRSLGGKRSAYSYSHTTLHMPSLQRGSAEDRLGTNRCRCIRFRSAPQPYGEKQQRASPLKQAQGATRNLMLGRIADANNFSYCQDARPRCSHFGSLRIKPVLHLHQGLANEASRCRLGFDHDKLSASKPPEQQKRFPSHPTPNKRTAAPSPKHP